MLYLTCTTISSVDLAQYGESLAKDWVSVDCGTINVIVPVLRIFFCCLTKSETIFILYRICIKALIST